MKKIYKLIFSFLISVSFVTPFLVKDVSAVVDTYKLPYDEPSTSDGEGYISVLFQNSSGGYFVMTWIWNITNESGLGVGGMKLSITDKSIEFTAQLPTNQNGYSFIYRYNGAGDNITVNQYQYFSTSCNPPYKYSTSSYTIVGYQAKGNVKHIIDEKTTDKAFRIAWGNDNTTNELLNDLIDSVNSSNDLDDDILTEIQNLNGDLDTIKTKVNSILTELKSTNTWLENIRSGIKLTNEYLIEVRDSVIETLEWVSGAMYDRLIDIKNAILGDVDDDGHIIESEDLNDQLSNKVEDYDSIESDLVGGLTENLQNITPNNDLFTQSDFVKTGVFLSTQMTNIYHSNNIVTALFTFGMILGLAFTIIGISAKR